MVTKRNFKKVLIVVDVQNDFVDGALGTKEAQAIISNVAKKITEAERNGNLLIYTRDAHYENTYMNTEEGKNLPIPHCIRYTEGWAIHKDVPVPEYATIFDKETFGSYELGTYLRTYNDVNIDTIELIGLCTDICVLSNAVEAKAACPNAHIIVDAACCAGVMPESHDTALDAMKAIQVEVINRGQEPWR